MVINLISEELFGAISTCGRSPRTGHKESWLLKDRKIVLAYISPNRAEREVRYFHYSFPKHKAQIVIFRRFYQKALNIVSEMFKITDIIKYLTPHIILELN